MINLRTFACLSFFAGLMVSAAHAGPNVDTAIHLARGIALTAWAADCNGNTIEDECDIDCGVAAGPCDVPGCGGSQRSSPNGAAP